MKKYTVRILIVLVLAFIAFLITPANKPGELEMLVEDRMYQHPGVIPDDIKIIRIDEQTLEALGPYSEWERRYFAQLIDILSENPDNAPKVIGIDIIFTGTRDSESDKALVDAVRRAGNVVVTSKLELDGRIVAQGDNTYYRKAFVKSEAKPYEELAEVCSYGFSNPLIDADGYIRRAYGMVMSDDIAYKSFSYKIAELAYGKEGIKIDKAKFGFAYTGNPGDFEAISMTDVLSGKVPSDYFSDSVVLIGVYEEGLMDAYSIPVNHAKEMYGVEVQANVIQAIRTGAELAEVNKIFQRFISLICIFLFAAFVYIGSLKSSFIKLTALVIGYPLIAYMLYSTTGYELYILYIPVCAIICELTFFTYRYVALQKRRAAEVQKTLFSMADSMAQAIEGRTPYNASHTKNVAKRCVEMLDYINKLHKEGKSNYHFSKADKDQMYLAAMLHDIGKMDVPTLIMDKPTKLGALEEPLRARIREIKLLLENAHLKQSISKNEYDDKISLIESFVNGLGGLNCGRPLRDEEKELLEQMKAAVFITADGEEIPYLTQEEYDDLTIRAGTLTENERLIMQSHVVHTDKILSHVYFGEAYKDVRRMASNHHELMNGKGYPNQIGADQLDVMTRILTIMDIYDSLIADDRPYKKPKDVPIAFKILDEECEAGKVDRELLDIAKQIWLKEEEKDTK